MTSSRRSRVAVTGLALFVTVTSIALSAPAHAVGLKECAEKYNAAKNAGTLGAQGWNEYRKANCAEPAKAAPASPSSSNTAEAATPDGKAAPAMPLGTAIFPTMVAAQFAVEKPAKARMHTCLAQYKANKTSNANGGMRWIEKGGGYYSQCNKRLKGTSA